MNSFPNFPSFLLPRENPHSEEEGTHFDMTSYLVPIPSGEGSSTYHEEISSTYRIHTSLENIFGDLLIANETQSNTIR